MFSNPEAARSHPQAEENGPAHDAYTRLLYRARWRGVVARSANLHGAHSRILIIDDNTLDKPYARAMELVTRHWSGKHHRIVLGINLLRLLWTDGAAHWP